MPISTTSNTPSGEENRPASEPTSARKIVFVAGSGRSGTSTLSGILRQLGMHVPQPEVVPDDTNPRGFGEPQWAVDFHTRLLKQACVHMSDARPQAWFNTGKLATREKNRTELSTWLESHFAEADELVIKDPRLSWFLGLWRVAAIRVGADACFTTMLRPPTETVGSKYKYYRRNAASHNFADGIAGWVNLMLHTERATRGSKRTFIRYHDLLDDWTVPVFRAGDALDLDAVKSAAPDDIRRVHNFIDPSLRRVQLTWEEVPVPRQLRELASETWDQLSTLAEPEGDNQKTLDELDRLLDEYIAYYGDAEAVAKSSIIAAKQQERRNASKPKKATQAPVSKSRKIVNLIPHSVRAAIPAGARRRLRRAAATIRRSSK